MFGTDRQNLTRKLAIIVGLSALLLTNRQLLAERLTPNLALGKAQKTTETKWFRIKNGDNPVTDLFDLSDYGDSFHYARFADGKLAVVAEKDGYSDKVNEALLILDKDGRLLGSTPLKGNEYYPSSLVVSDTGLVAVKSSSGDSQVIEVFDSNSGSPKQISAFDGKKRRIYAFSPFEDVLVVSKRVNAEIDDRSMPVIVGTIEYIDIQTGECISTCSAP